MHTARLMGGIMTLEGGVWPEGGMFSGSLSPLPPWRDKHVQKHYLPAASFVGGKYFKLIFKGAKPNRSQWNMTFAVPLQKSGHLDN